MRTHIIGARKPVSLGFCAPATVNAATAALNAVPQGTQFAVVSIALAARMQGYTANKSKTGRGTMYALYSTYNAASAHIKAHRMQFYATVVAW